MSMALGILWAMAAVVSAFGSWSAGDYAMAFVYAAAALIIPGAFLLLVRRP